MVSPLQKVLTPKPLIRKKKFGKKIQHFLVCLYYWSHQKIELLKSIGRLKTAKVFLIYLMSVKSSNNELKNTFCDNVTPINLAVSQKVKPKLVLSSCTNKYSLLLFYQEKRVKMFCYLVTWKHNTWNKKNTSIYTRKGEQFTSVNS